MSASSRSTIFSLRSKKSKDSADLPSTTHAGPAYDNLPMSPRGPPITVSTIVPPSQQHNDAGSLSRYYTDTSARLFYGDDATDDGSDSYSVKSEPRNGYGTQSSLKGGSLGGAGGLSGPRPLPPRTGSAEKIALDGTSKHNNSLGHTESPHVFCFPLVRGRSLTVETTQETRFFGSWIDTVSGEQCLGRFQSYGPNNFPAPNRRRLIKVV